MSYIINLRDVNLSHVDLVGGKNASTGELIQNLSRLGVNVPEGFAVTTQAFRDFLRVNHLDKKIKLHLANVRVNKPATVKKASLAIKKAILAASLFPELETQINKAIKAYPKQRFAVRSSATAEDCEDTSFAGLQETYLNISAGKPLLRAIKLVFASLYNARAIAYRHHQGVVENLCLISVGIQPMVRSDKATSGVMFTIDPESGFKDVVVINATYGLGEGVVQGGVIPDEFVVYKPSLLTGKTAILKRERGSKEVKMIYNQHTNPDHAIKSVKVFEKERHRYCLSDDEVNQLALQGILIEKHYKKPMDIEWAKDGLTGKIYIVQARPETVKSRAQSAEIERYVLERKSTVLARGQSIGQKIGSGNAIMLASPKMISAFKPGDVLVTDMTDPDWEPIMKLASAIVTNRGGRTCHAAIIARELGVPAIVGCQQATRRIKNGMKVTVSCADGEIGLVYSGKLPFHVKKFSVAALTKIPVKLCLNIGNPDIAFINRCLPHQGVGLARLEFIISSMIGIHPNAILAYSKLKNSALKKQIKLRTMAYASPKEFYIERLREGMSQIAAAYAPHDVIFRFSDFKSNEYANLLGGDIYEPHEENPMIGFRGASRYRNELFIPCFELECIAIKRLREDAGLINVQVMIPFVRTIKELEEVLKIMQKFGLRRGQHGLKVFMMCEVPSNVILADAFLSYIDGFSIGSNDLTQLTLGIDRDSEVLAKQFDERDPAVQEMIKSVIGTCKRQNKYIGICGQAPSDHPDFAKWLMQQNIDAISLNPDTIVDTWVNLAKGV
jgi:pyruvate,water dikinase